MSAQETHVVDGEGDQVRIYWPDDQQQPNRRLVVRCVSGDFDLSEETMPFRGATRCDPSERMRLCLTLEDAQWLAAALTKTVEVEVSRRAALEES